MGLSLEAICAFLWLSFQMRLICNQYVNEKQSSGRDVEENVLFVTSGTAAQQFISLCQYRSIISVFSDLIDYENNWQAAARHGIITCSFAYEADYGQYVLTSNLPRETARASRTSRGLAIFKPTFGRGARCLPQQRLLEPSSNPTQRHCP